MTEINGYKIEPMANLYGANLYGADLRDANLYGANLYGANLSCADLLGANLSCADLGCANLSCADLGCADLGCANLSCANLRDANLRDANLLGANLPDFQIVPEVGQFNCFKRVSDGVILELLVPSSARRTSSLVGRKCRVSHATVLGASDAAGNPVTGGEFTSYLQTNNPITYRVGEAVYADSFDDDIRVECSHGIHVFITRKEAVEFT